MSQPENENEMIAVLCECIVRNNDLFSIAGHAPWLTFVGATQGLANAVERVNDGKATEADLLILSAFPVIDADVSNIPEILMEVR